jgi:hypothetical protein
MSYTIAMPQTLPVAFGMGFNMLIRATSAFPYKVDGVATVGVEDGSDQQLPSLIELDSAYRSVPVVPYEGSAMLSELLESPVHALRLSSVPLVDESGKGGDVFVNAAKEDMSAGEFISKYRGTPDIADLAYVYSEAAVAMDRLAARTESTQAPVSMRNDMSDLLGRLSPIALQAAEKNAFGLPATLVTPYIHYAKHCLLFLAGALSASYRHAECAQYAITSLGMVGDFFDLNGKYFEGGEELAIKATAYEVMAEMLRVHRLPGESVYYTYPQQLLSKAAKVWIKHIDRNGSDPEYDYDGVYRRALNAAQWGPDYGALGDLFMIAKGRQTEPLDSAQFLIRAAWAVLMDESGDRPEAERWEMVSEYLKRAEDHLGGGAVTGGDQLAGLASKVRARADLNVEELIAHN